MFYIDLELFLAPNIIKLIAVFFFYLLIGDGNITNDFKSDHNIADSENNIISYRI